MSEWKRNDANEIVYHLPQEGQYPASLHSVATLEYLKAHPFLRPPSAPPPFCFYAKHDVIWNISLVNSGQLSPVWRVGRKVD